MHDRVINILAKLAIELNKKSSTVYVTYCPNGDSWSVMTFTQQGKKSALLDMSNLHSIEPQVREFVLANAKKMVCPQ